MTRDAAQAATLEARVIADRDAACAVTLLDALAKASSCGDGARAVATGLFAGENVTATAITSVLSHARGTCEAVVLRALHGARDVDEALAVAVTERARDEGSAEDRAPAWLALGSVAAIAREHGRTKIANDVDRHIAARLSRSRGEARVVHLSAAGNAGCVPCLGAARASANDEDVRVRSAATSAWRLVVAEEASRKMCHALATDPDGSVRDQAAWALGWSASERDRRVTCLARAARSDDTGAVRLSSVASLIRLSADDALRALEDDFEAPRDVRLAITEHFMTTERRSDVDEKEPRR